MHDASQAEPCLNCSIKAFKGGGQVCGQVGDPFGLFDLFEGEVAGNGQQVTFYGFSSDIFGSGKGPNEGFRGDVLCFLFVSTKPVGKAMHILGVFFVQFVKVNDHLHILSPEIENVTGKKEGQPSFDSCPFYWLGLVIAGIFFHGHHGFLSWAFIKEFKALKYNLGVIPCFALFFVFFGFQAPLKKNQASFVQVFLANLSKTLPGFYVDPFGGFFHFTVSVFPTIADRNAEGGHFFACRGELAFRVSAQAANQLDAV